MVLQQAVFTSAQSRRGRGYHVVAVSAGMPDALTERLNHWGPSHDSLILRDVTAQSISYFATDDDWFILARTGFGGPEYSQRGSLQVVTRILAFRSNQLAAFDGCPMTLCRAALALGYLRLLFEPAETLPELDLPASTYLGQKPTGHSANPEITHSVQRHLREDGRVAVLNVEDGVELVSAILHEMTPEDRSWLSFTTGLKPSRHRQFRLNLSPVGDARLAREYLSQGIACVR